MLRSHFWLALLSALAICGSAAKAGESGTTEKAGETRRYSHIFVIIAENQDYDTIVGNPQNAPYINQLIDKKEAGLAKNYYGVTHPSEPNYIAMLGGDTFGIQDDDAWYCKPGQTDRNCEDSKKPGYAGHTITARSLTDQLQETKENDKPLTWKGYFESIPSPGWTGIDYPSKEYPVYASKHNGFINFKSVQEDPDLTKKFVTLERLDDDLRSDNGTNAPNFAHIVLNQCNDMHGISRNIDADCRKDSLESRVRQGDEKIKSIVEKIKSSTVWADKEKNIAIVITWDEDSNPKNKERRQGCCSCAYSSSPTNYGGGHIPTLVIVNNPPKDWPSQDSTYYNHYSLLRTVEEAFGIDEYLGHANEDGCGVKPMTPLFGNR